MKIQVFARTLAVLGLLGSEIALAGSVRCTTYEVKSLLVAARTNWTLGLQ
jgi:hypothetical protein